MKNKWGMTEEEKAEEVRKRMLRSATAVYNACIISYKENRCKGCPFSCHPGCNLYGHPIEWEDKLKQAKTRVQ